MDSCTNKKQILECDMRNSGSRRKTWVSAVSMQVAIHWVISSVQFTPILVEPGLCTKIVEPLGRNKFLCETSHVQQNRLAVLNLLGRSHSFRDHKASTMDFAMLIAKSPISKHLSFVYCQEISVHSYLRWYALGLILFFGVQ